MVRGQKFRLFLDDGGQSGDGLSAVQCHVMTLDTGQFRQGAFGERLVVPACRERII